MISEQIFSLHYTNGHVMSMKNDRREKWSQLWAVQNINTTRKL